MDADAPQARLATAEDWPAIWRIWREVVGAGDTYVWAPSTSESDAQRAWMLPSPAEVWLLEAAGSVVGTAQLKANAAGLGGHVANAAFMVDPAQRGKAFGRTLAAAVLERARALGFEAMQFNAVVATNTAAVALWESLGFSTVGRVPGAFRHAALGPVDLLVMHKRL